ncbi:unnamed protein product [Toxocara canis]|uniref:Peptidase A2 domain-containing protein n=1 Tax=Toxocara canis TaxID=6265 RepID=A0A183V245_TOXCA|nr:unnamed protein product [Toxocara canis]
MRLPPYTGPLFALLSVQRMALGDKVLLHQQDVPGLKARRPQERRYCKKKKGNSKTRRTTNNVLIIASTGRDVAPVSRIYRNIQINGITVQMRLDTGADVTLLSIKESIKVSRPKLLPRLAKLKSANNRDIRVRGYFDCDFDIDGHKGKGNCYVADTQS